MNAKRRVSRGAKLLDRKYPDWERQIDVEYLYMNNSCDCILGQLYTNFWLGCTKLDIRAAAWYGFDIPKFNWYSPIKAKLVYSDLKQAWIEEINDRVAAKGAAGSTSA